jgi:hypothetical protein
MECRVRHTHRAAKARKVLVCPFFPLSARHVISTQYLRKNNSGHNDMQRTGSLGEEAAARVAVPLGFSPVDKARLAQLFDEKDLEE